MRYSMSVPNFGDFADPETFVEVAKAAEEVGWDGLFVWDHMVEQKSFEREVADPWVLLAAAAMATERIRLGTMVTPVARRRPQKLAREITTLDRLSNGRMVLGVGLGAPIDDEFGSFGEPTDARVLAGRLDEGLEVLDALWSGERVDYSGKHHTVSDVVFHPVPTQRPRIPIWVGGMWPNRAPLRRAARWDGSVPVFTGGFESVPPPVEQVHAWHTDIQARRAEFDNRGHFEFVVGGKSDPAAVRDVIGPLADAGATWWDERMPFDDEVDKADPVRRRIEKGVPRID